MKILPSSFTLISFNPHDFLLLMQHDSREKYWPFAIIVNVNDS